MPNIIFKWAIHGLFCLQLRANNNRFKLPITGFEPVLQTMPQQPIAHTEPLKRRKMILSDPVRRSVELSEAKKKEEI